MQTRGTTREGWMTLIPLSVFIFVVIVTLGGPTAFMNVVSNWVTDAVAAVAHWLKDL